MGTKIAWTDETWQPVVGCSKVSEGCCNCYAERMAGRLANMGQAKYMMVVSQKAGTGTIKYNKRAIYLQKWNGKTYCDESALDKPLHWKKPRRIFVCSMGDLFHKSVPFGFIEKVMAVIEDCPQHTFQILTKRPGIMLEYFNGLGKRYELSCLPNLWPGVTIESPNHWKRAKILQEIPAPIKFLSLEPLLADLGDLDLRDISWVIVGCESGPKRRECKIEWVLNIVDQCRTANVPLFVKQLHDQNTGELIKCPRGWPRKYPQENL